MGFDYLCMSLFFIVTVTMQVTATKAIIETKVVSSGKVEVGEALGLGRIDAVGFGEVVIETVGERVGAADLLGAGVEAVLSTVNSTSWFACHTSWLEKCP
jgi:hypothetical protein